MLSLPLPAPGSLARRLAALLIAGAAALAAPLAAGAAEINLTYAFFAPAGTFPGKQMAHWAEEIAKRTNGKVVVKTFPAGTLLGAREMYDGVTKGVADIGLGAPSYDPGRFPLTSGVSLPVGFPNATVASRVLWEITKEFQPREFENFKVIAMFTTEPGYIQSRKPAGTAAELAGMKLRAAGTGVPVLKALGAAPVGMPMPEVPQSVQTGVIDGTMTSREVLQDFKLAETLKYVTDYPTVVVTFAAVMDRKRFDALPADVKKVIDELGPEMAVWTGQYHDKQNVGGALEWAKKTHNLQIVPVSAQERAAWDARLEPMQSEWVKEMTAKGLPAAKYLARMRELRDQYMKQ
jgi:TRAP-type C4-dicarboxylate transport system substrate-binding protein